MTEYNVNLNSPIDIREAGLNALNKALGPVGAARFMQQFENGIGDYTSEKYLIPDEPIDQLLIELKKYK